MLLVEVEDLFVHVGHQSAFRTHLPEGLVLDVLVGVDELQVPLLDVLLGLAEFLQFALVLPLVLALEFEVLVVLDGLVMVHEGDLLQLPVEFLLELFLLEQDVGDVGEDVALEELVPLAFEAELLGTATFPLLVQYVLHGNLIAVVLEEEPILVVGLSWLQVGIVVETSLLHTGIKVLLQLGRFLSDIVQLLLVGSRERSGVSEVGNLRGLYLGGVLAGGFFC